MVQFFKDFAGRQGSRSWLWNDGEKGCKRDELSVVLVDKLPIRYLMLVYRPNLDFDHDLRCSLQIVWISKFCLLPLVRVNEMNG